MDGKISIAKVSSNVEDDYIGIDIVFGSVIIRGKISLEDYGKVISGQAGVNIDIHKYITKEKPNVPRNIY